ncbi:MAG: conjugative transposon protein TraN [Chitinophagaceae bacterium]
MKRMCVLIGLCSLLFSATGQVPLLPIAADKTTSLVFPSAILHVDRGTKDILVQQVKEADHILLVKAAQEKVLETNLSVVTADGGVYLFSVTFKEHPDTLVYYLPTVRRSTVAVLADEIQQKKGRTHHVKDFNGEVAFRLSGVYINNNIIFCQLRIKNKSAIDYSIDYSRFFIKDKHKSKRTASQENEIVPVYSKGNLHEIKAFTNSVVVVALEKFTIPDDKYLYVQLMEKNGGRNVQLRIKNKKIIHGIRLDDLKR